ncbi:MAG: DUF4465 domain-containing protein [Bacteroidia bacterium]|nr:DUF4465 domain-containing protein [Bacteroidia bacterium]
MKTILLKVKIIVSVFIILGTAQTQTISTFESLNLGTNNYWNGKDFSGGFNNGNAFFVNHFDTSFGDYWEGFAASTTTNDTTKSYTNQYSAVTGKGYNNSNTYAVNYGGGKILLKGAAQGKVVMGFYITNSTYSYYGMKNGTSISKKFGDSTGNYPDFFKIVISGWKDAGTPTDTVEFYLADYRFSDNSKDYIVKNWQWLDLSKLGNMDSLSFNYHSSDTGMYGINNPQYFCMDNFTTRDIKSGLSNTDNKIIFSLYPNPANDILHLSLNQINGTVKIFNLQGELLISDSNHDVNISSLKPGIYCVEVRTEEAIAVQKFIKQ